MANAHRVLLFTGGKYHDWAGGAEAISRTLAAAGIECVHSPDASAIASLANGRFDCVMLYNQGDYFNDPAIEILATFVRNGGGLVGVHGATTYRNSPGMQQLFGSKFSGHGPVMEFKVSASDPDHPIAHRIQPFRVTDELYTLESHGDYHTFLTAWWNGTQHAMGYARNEGKGKVVYLANGHSPAALDHPTVKQLLVRAVRYATGEDWSKKTVKVGIIGYGGAFNMGRFHAERCNAARLQTVAVTDIDPARAATAKTELGEHVQTFTKVEEMLDKSDVEMCVVITPHHTHAPLSIQCLEAGRHVVTEKPYTITVEEATQVIETAARVGKMATVFHNRRWDGDFMTMRDIVRSGTIGDVFHIECFFGGYHEPRTDWWRSYKQFSGGAFYDWGAHFCDWVLNLMPHKIESVAGSFHKRVWHQVSNEDHTEALIRFEGGRTAHLEQSAIAAIGKSRFRILGTRGGIEQKVVDWEGKLGIDLVTFADGKPVRSNVPCRERDVEGFYHNVADHLILGEPLAVTPESARQVIAVLSLAEQSSRQGGVPIPLPFEP